MSGVSGSDADPEAAVLAMASVFLGAIVALVAVEWPVLVWSTVHGAPTVMDVPSAIGGGVRWLIVGPHHDPSAVPAWHAYRDVLPPPRTRETRGRRRGQ